MKVFPGSYPSSARPRSRKSAGLLSVRHLQGEPKAADHRTTSRALGPHCKWPRRDPAANKCDEFPAVPIEQAVKFTLAINQKTAKQLGIIPSPTMLAAADEVIE